MAELQEPAGQLGCSPQTESMDLGLTGRERIAVGLNTLLADFFALYVKTKSYHWHMTGRQFRDHHLLLDEQSGQIFDATDAMAERVRKVGKPTIRSVGQIARLRRIPDDDSEQPDPVAMLASLLADNKQIVRWLREAHKVCDLHGDVATTSLIEIWIDEAERRVWFLSEICGGK